MASPLQSVAAGSRPAGERSDDESDSGGASHADAGAVGSGGGGGSRCGGGPRRIIRNRASSEEATVRDADGQGEEEDGVDWLRRRSSSNESLSDDEDEEYEPSWQASIRAEALRQRVRDEAQRQLALMQSTDA